MLCQINSLKNKEILFEKLGIESFSKYSAHSLPEITSNQVRMRPMHIVAIVN